MTLDYPYQFDRSGWTATTDDEDHIRDLIEQVLFTAPGERVNRPTSAAACCSLVFAPNSDTLASATQFLVQGALQQWLGDLIQVGHGGASSTTTPRCGSPCSTRSGGPHERQVVEFTR